MGRVVLKCGVSSPGRIVLGASCLTFHQIRYKPRRNDLIELFKLYTGSLWCIIKSSDIYNIGINMPGDRLCSVG